MKLYKYILIIVIFVTTTSFKNLTAIDFGGKDERIAQLYPNPAVSNIYFDIPTFSDKTYTLQIFNFIGKKVLETKINSFHTNINISDFYRGIYVYQLRSSNGAIVESGKFQVAR